MAVVGLQTYLLIFDDAPQPLDEHAVPTNRFATLIMRTAKIASMHAQFSNNTFRILRRDIDKMPS